MAEYLPPVIAQLLGDASDALRSLTELQAAIDALDGKTIEILINADTGRALADAEAVQTRIDSMESSIPVSLSYGEALIDLAVLQEAVEKPLTIPVHLDTAALAGQLATLGGVGGAPGVGGAGGEGGAGGAGGGGGGLGLLGLLGFGKGGGGRFGFLGALPGLFTAGSLAGFGAESIGTTALGILGSGAGAAAGAGLLGLGGAAVTGVGMATDAAGIGQALNDTKLYSQAVSNLTAKQEQYNAVVAQYGAASAQAGIALKQLQSAQVSVVGTLQGIPAAAQGAVAALTETIAQFKALFDAWTGQAEAVGAKILNQMVQIGEQFLPIIGSFALQNMNIIRSGLQPLFSWIQGPGMSIFTDLEAQFSANLPTAVHAFSQGLELLIKIMDDASHYTGGIIDAIDKWVTKLNGADWGRVQKGINTAIGVFRVWWGLIKNVGDAIYQLFTHDAGTGTAIIGMISQMVREFDNWAKTIAGGDQLHTLLEAHKQEILSLLSILPHFLSAFGQLDLTMRPAIMNMVTLLADLANALLSIPWVGQFLAGAAAIEVMGTRLRILGAILSPINNQIRKLAIDGLHLLGSALLAISNRLLGMGGGLAGAGGILSKLGGWFQGIGVQAPSTTAAIEALTVAITENTAALRAGSGAATAYGASLAEVRGLSAEASAVITASNAEVAASSAEADASLASTSRGVSGLGGVLPGLAGGLSGTALAVGGLAIGMAGLAFYLTSLQQPFGQTTIQADNAAVAMASHARGVAGLSAAIQNLQSQLTSSNAVLYSTAGLQNSVLGGTDQLAAATNKVVAALNAARGSMQTYNSNVQQLGQQSGLTKQQVEVLAQSIGIDLTKPISPASFQTWSQTVQTDMQQTGGVTAAVQAIISTNMQAMAINATAAAQNTHSGVVSQLTPLVADLTSIGQDSTAGLVQKFLTAVAKAGAASQNIHNSVINPLEPLVAQLLTIGDISAANFVQGLVNKEGATQTAAQRHHDLAKNTLQPLINELNFVGDSAAANLVAGLSSQEGATGGAARSLHNVVIQGVGTFDFSGVGANVGNSLAGGINAAAQRAVAAASAMAAQVSSAVAGILKIASPSQVMMAFGHNIAQGLAVGILEETPNTINSAKGIATLTMLAIAGVLKISSPSQVMVGYGKDIVQGLANGIRNNGNIVITVMRNIATSVSAIAKQAVLSVQQMTSSVTTGPMGAPGITAQATAFFSQPSAPQSLKQAITEMMAGAPSGVSTNIIGVSSQVAANIEAAAQQVQGIQQQIQQLEQQIGSGTLNKYQLGNANEQMAKLQKQLASITNQILAQGAIAGGGSIMVPTVGSLLNPPSPSSSNAPMILQVTTPIQINGQTIAQQVTKYQLQQGRGVGTVLGQYAGGTQTQSATGINPNAIAR